MHLAIASCALPEFKIHGITTDYFPKTQLNESQGKFFRIETKSIFAIILRKKKHRGHISRKITNNIARHVAFMTSLDKWQIPLGSKFVKLRLYVGRM
jgi:hypothetical protein